MKKNVAVVFSEEAERAYQELRRKTRSSKLEKSILHAIIRKIECIKENVHYGNPVAKKLIPEEYAKAYGIRNLFRVELPCFWRMLYTLKGDGDEVEIIAFVLDVLDHKEYSRKFKYV